MYFGSIDINLSSYVYYQFFTYTHKIRVLAQIRPPNPIIMLHVNEMRVNKKYKFYYFHIHFNQQSSAHL